MLGPKYPYDGLAMWCRAVRHGHGAGLPLERVFAMQARSGPLPLRGLAGRIAERLRDGETLEDSLAGEGDRLPELFVSLAVLGEQAGNIPGVFGHLEEYYQLHAQLRREFIAQITWPVVQFIGGVLVIAFTIFVLGLLAPENPTEPIGFGLSGTSGAIVFLVVVGATVGGVLLAIKLFTSTVARQQSFEAFLLRVPMVGPCLRAVALTRFCLAMRLTLDSAMPVDKALRLSLRATGNSTYTAQEERICKRVKKGEEIGAALGTNAIFPGEFLATVSVGEVSGQLPEVMAKQTDYYRDEAARRMKAATKALAWFVYGVVALFMIAAIIVMFSGYQRALESVN